MFTRLNKMEGKVIIILDVNIQHCASRVIQHRLRRQLNIQHSTFNTQHSTFYIPIRLTARAERYCDGEPLIQLLLDDVAKERCREWIEEKCNSQTKKING